LLTTCHRSKLTRQTAASSTCIDANFASAALSICCSNESSKIFGSETRIPVLDLLRWSIRFSLSG
jgi:hypothetical protein